MPTPRQERRCPTCRHTVYFNVVDHGYICRRCMLRWRFGNTWVKVHGLLRSEQ